MKKVLAIALSVMLFAIMLVPAASALVTPAVTMRAAEGAYADDAVAKDVIEDTTFTVYFKFPPVTKLCGVDMYVQFDTSVLQVVEGGQAGKIADEELTPYFSSGVFASGIKTLADDEYAFGWGQMEDKGINKSKATDFSYLTFKVIDKSVSSTTLNLYINEFETNDGDDDNDVDSTTLAESKVIYFNFEDYSEPETDPEETDPTEPEDINDLLQIIKDMLSGNGATFEDFADAITNILGNADITDMIEQLLGGDFDIGGGFLDSILGGLDLDFGAFEDILNTIIDFFSGLFGGGGDDPAPVNPTTPATTQAAQNTTNAADNPEATTSQGSQQGSEGTGDAGIALAATVCVAAGAAFALTRKKKETV